MQAHWEFSEKGEWLEGFGSKSEFWHDFKRRPVDIAIVQLEDGRRFIYYKGEWKQVR